jgi:hypothetical protein
MNALVEHFEDRHIFNVHKTETDEAIWMMWSIWTRWKVRSVLIHLDQVRWSFYTNSNLSHSQMLRVL